MSGDDYLGTDEATYRLLQRRSIPVVFAARYDNPESDLDDTALRFIQPAFFVQGKYFLIACWQYAPSLGWRTFHLTHFQDIDTTAYPPLFDPQESLSLDVVCDWNAWRRSELPAPYTYHSPRRAVVEEALQRALRRAREFSTDSVLHLPRLDIDAPSPQPMRFAPPRTERPEPRDI